MDSSVFGDYQAHTNGDRDAHGVGLQQSTFAAVHDNLCASWRIAVFASAFTLAFIFCAGLAVQTESSGMETRMRTSAALAAIFGIVALLLWRWCWTKRCAENSLERQLLDEGYLP